MENILTYLGSVATGIETHGTGENPKSLLNQNFPNPCSGFKAFSIKCPTRAG